ncbi:rhomboid family protease [Oleiphilus messinensis]|uniref:Rhomboid family protease n=1 Tax=Oleiphilus messinensis TaxID=141451 RepID=A0A1Y0IDD4_9GAMM|nr:rhomboid family intramembrane serine protease [Oleiphilus messinensis]ARU58280.1 rhomboid family protease [Oleiphilus messinensis]
MQKIAELPVDEDLRFFVRWIILHRVSIRVVEERGVQVVYVDNSMARDVQSVLMRYSTDPEFRTTVRSEVEHKSRPLEIAKWHTVTRPAQAWVVAGLIAICAFVALITSLGSGGPVLRALTFADPFHVVDDTIRQRLDVILLNITEGQLWRFLTPAFLHFSMMHILFNMMWLWYLGAMVEIKQGRQRFLLIFMFSAILSNIGQYLESDQLFGGMSGVVYALFGYCWFYDRRFRPVFRVPDGLFIFIIGWLLLGYTGWADAYVGKMANSAHLIGLLSGLLLALLPSRRGQDSEQQLLHP